MSETIKTDAPQKPIILSGIQPSGVLTLGNYLGAVRNWVQLQKDYRCAYCIVDLHAITVRQEPAALRENSLSAYALLLAAGVNPDECIAFIQSHVPAHAELAWVLNTFTPFGDLGRMTQFKDKSARYAENINAGLFTYPVLMAADILLYQSNLVPVGADQKQHIELARDVAIRFNTAYGNTFTIPEPYIPKEGARVMSLQDPTKKMSKSDPNPKAYVGMLEKPDQIIKKFKSAVTDSDAQVAYREGKEGINNLMSIYAAVTGKSYDAIENEFAGKGYGDFKTAVGETVVEVLRPIRQEFDRLMTDKGYLESCYRTGAEKASAMAERTLQKVYKKVGFVPRSV